MSRPSIGREDPGGEDTGSKTTGFIDAIGTGARCAGPADIAR